MKFFFRYSGFLDYSGNQLQLDTDVNFSKTKGTGSAKLQLPQQKPFGTEIKFNCNHKDSGDVTATFTFGDNKKITASVKGQMPDEKSLTLASSLSGNLEQFSEITFNLDAKSPEVNQIVSKISGKIDGKPYNLDYEHRLSPQNPKVYLLMTCTRGEIVEIV